MYDYFDEGDGKTEITGQHKTDDSYTYSSNPLPWTAQGDRTYLPWLYGTLFYNSEIYWTSKANINEGKLPGGKTAQLKSGVTVSWWLRSPCSAWSTMVFAIDEQGECYPYKVTDQKRGIRPALKLDPTGILFASEIKNNADPAKGEIHADSNYVAGSGGINFKLTILNSSLILESLSGPNGGALGNTSTLNILSGGSVNLTGTVAGGANKLVYKIVDRSSGSIVGYGAGSAANLTVSSAGLLPGGDYTLYVWAQKDNPTTSHEGSNPIYIYLNVYTNLSFTSANSYAVGSGKEKVFQVTTDGIPAADFYYIEGAPDGVSIDSETGKMIIARNMEIGTYTFTITAANGIAPDAKQTFTLMVVDPPVRKAEVPPTAEASVILGRTYTLDLGEVFEDPDSGVLTYLVSVNGADYIEADISYIHTPQALGITTLVFKAQNVYGVESADTYTVTLTTEPIPITTAEELNSVRSDLSSHYILKDNINLNGANWEPFGTFSGSFDGNGYTIYNFKINKNGSSNVGFFRVIEADAEVKNLILENYSVTASECVGGLAGKNHGHIIGCSARGSVVVTTYTNYANIGGLVGYNEGTIENSNTTGNVTAYGISNNAGGLVGCNDGGTITGCYAAGDVYSSYFRVGGLVGVNSGKSTINANIANCYALGNVSGEGAVGGLVGTNLYSTASITNCYAIGTVSGGANSMGGLVGKNSNSGSISSSYYNTETCGVGADNGIGTGKTTMELMQKATFAGWNFADGGIWKIGEGTSYPVLQWQPVPPVINTATLAGGKVGTPYSQILTSSGDEPITWTVESGNLPDGLSLTDSTISGTPTTVGTFSFIVKAANTAGEDTQEFSIVIISSVNISDISGVTVPARGAVPVTTITETEQYTGSVEWSPADNPFKASTVYTATITLIPKEGYTLDGVAANLFTVAGADTVSNSANSGVITAVFPVTEAVLNSIEITTPPTKQTYIVGESLDISGMVVTGYYSDGSTKVESITEANLTGFDSSVPAESQTLTVTVDGKTATYTISVILPSVTGPSLQSAVTNSGGNKIILSFDKAMADPSQNAGAFSVNVNHSGAVSVVTPTIATLGKNDKKIELTLAQKVSVGDKITLYYTPGTVRAADGGVLGEISAKTVINYVPSPVTTDTVIVEPDKPIQSITDSTPTGAPISITVPDTVSNAGINIADLLNPAHDGVITSDPLPALNISAAIDLNNNGSTVNVQVVIPGNTTVSVPDGTDWDGIINVPTVVEKSSVTVTPTAGTTVTVTSVIEVGFGDIPLTFNKAVRILIPGQAGNKVGYTRSGVFTSITRVLGADDQNTADTTLSDGGDGYIINVGADLVIWTKHFTKFVTYTETPVDSGSQDGSGGGSTSVVIENEPQILERIFGQDRYDTAVQIAKSYFSNGADTVILARGDISADALTAVPLCRYYNAPLLLTPQDRLPQGVLDEIKALGAKNVIIMGGEGAVSSDIADTLTNLGLKVKRISGTNRYDTAYKTAVEIGTTGKAVIVNGNDISYPDALSISSWAAYNKVPILYTDGTDTLPEETVKAINELKVTETILIGGYGVLPKALESILPKPVRYGGDNRFDTNAKVLGELQPKSVNIFAATGNDFANALSIAAVAGQNNAWLILTGSTSLTGSQTELLLSVKGSILDYHIVGGTGAVSDDMLSLIKELLGIQ